MIAKVQKKYKHTKKALNASQRPNESTAKELIPYPTGQTHGRGGYNVADDLFEKSGVTKEGYNTFVIRSSTPRDCHPLISSRSIPIDISPSNDGSRWNPDDSYLASRSGRPSR